MPCEAFWDDLFLAVFSDTAGGSRWGSASFEGGFLLARQSELTPLIGFTPE